MCSYLEPSLPSMNLTETIKKIIASQNPMPTKSKFAVKLCTIAINDAQTTEMVPLVDQTTKKNITEHKAFSTSKEDAY